MGIKRVFYLLNYTERVIFISGYSFGIYYLCVLTAPIASKVFIFALFTFIFITFIRQNFNQEKPKHQVINNEVNKPFLSKTNIKYAALVSFVVAILLFLFIGFEIIVKKSSSYFPLKLIIALLLYLVFKRCLKLLVNQSL